MKARPPRRGPKSEDRVSPFSPQTFLVDGLAAVGEYVRFCPARMVEILCADKERAAVDALLAGHGLKVPVKAREVPKDAATTMAPVAARVTLQATELDTLFARVRSRPKDLILALDHITDPRNLGAIVRSAAFFGVSEVLVPERRQVLLTQAAVNTAQGGFALTDLVVTVNLARALQSLKDQGYWVIGTAMNGEPFSKLANVYDKAVLVLGAEDTGLSRNVAERCDRLAAISGRAPARGPGGSTASLDSLNVSVAAGIFLCEFTKNLGPSA